jgi:hypothetical protein
MKDNRVSQEVSGAADLVAGVVHGEVTHSRDTHIHVAPTLRVAATGDAEAWEVEIEKHRAFKRRVGIECSRVTRRHIERLLIEHDFTERQLRAVWRARALEFDDERGCLVTKPSRREAMLGYALFVFGALVVMPVVWMFLTSVTTPLQNASFFVSFGGYIAMLTYFCLYNLVEPYRVAKRLSRVLCDPGGTS